MEDEDLNPIVFSITEQEDLRKLRDFQNEHYNSCRKRFPDCTGAMFMYEVTPTGLGTLFVVKCPCGEELTLDGGMV